MAASLLLATACPVMATDFIVSNANDIDDASRDAQPGDTLLMTDGVWNNQDMEFGANGTASNPITLRPQNQGGVTLTGTSRLSITGSHLVVDGLTFDGGSRGDIDYIVEFRGRLGDADDCRLTNTSIIRYNPTSINTRYHWVNLYGQDNRVDHCRFEGHYLSLIHISEPTRPY